MRARLNTKYYDSDPVVCQTKNTARKIKQWNRENRRNEKTRKLDSNRRKLQKGQT